MKKVSSFIPSFMLLLLILPILVASYGCGSKSVTPKNDSILSMEYINKISITEPERALGIIDTIEQRGLMNDYDINRLRCVVYHNGMSDNIKALHYALKAYEAPSVRNNTMSYLRLIDMIADQYYLNGNYLQSIRFCTEGIKLAQDSLIKESEAALTFSLGRNLLFLNRKDEGLGYYKRAVDILDAESKKNEGWEASDEYIYTLATLIGTLRNEECYDEAIALLPRYDEAVLRLAKKSDLPPGLIDMRQASGYGMAAVLYAIKGETDKGHEQYLKLLSTEYSKTPDANQLLIPYLYQIGDYRATLSHLMKEKEYWQSNTDTVSYSYIHNHLESELDVYEKLGDIRSANRVLHTIQALNDTLRDRDRSEKALELAEIYKTNEQALQIERQSTSILIKNVIIVSTIIIIALALLFIIRILRFNKTISDKNQAMVKTIDELMGYKDDLFNTQEELIKCRAELDELKKERTETINTIATPEVDNSNSDDKANENRAKLTVGDRALYVRMNHEILARKLFLNPDFSRKELMTEFGISANKFAQLFREFAGCTFSQYIQNCRLDYSVKLMREHPQWSLEAIAKEVMMSNGAFYSHFKRKFQMRPSDFKAGEAKTSPQNQNE